MPYDDDDEESQQESGSELRKKLEQALKGNVALTEQLAQFQAEKLVQEKGLTLVKPDDLKGVELGKLEERATALQAERQQLQADLLRDAFARQGYEGDALERMVGSTESPAAALATARSMGRLDGTPVPAVDPSNLDPIGKMEYALSRRPKKA